MCRSRRELSNEYLLAKIGVDTAENEPLEVWGENSIQYSIVSLGVPSRAARGRTASSRRCSRRACRSSSSTRRRCPSRRSSTGAALRRRMHIELNFPPKLRGARSRLYRRRFLQINSRWKARYKIYNIYIHIYRSDLKISAKNRKHFIANE